MSKEQDNSGSDGEGRSQQEIPSAPSGGHSVDPRPSTSHLTIENVKKLQEDNPVSKSSLARQSVEAYLRQRHLLDHANEVSWKERKEPNLSVEKESEEQSVSLLEEEAAENDTETLEKISNPDFWTRSVTSSAPETKKREFADLETQTEWSYSSPSRHTSEEVSKTPGKDAQEKEVEGAESKGKITRTPGAERRGAMELGSIDSSEEGVADEVLEALHQAEDHYGLDYCGRCEFCAAALKHFPTPEELEDKPERMEAVPCCRTYKDIMQCVIQELMETQSPEGEIDITPHRRVSQTLLNSRTKIFLVEELREHGIENYKEIFEQYMTLSTWVKFGFKLSNEAPKPPPVAVKKRPRPKELLKIDVEFKPEQAKICHPINPVRRYYPDGKIFILLLPDGTGQV